MTPIPDHTYVGSFTLGDGVVISDDRTAPPCEVVLDAKPGTWHAYRGPRALLAVHESALDRVDDEALSYGGDLAAAVAAILRARGHVPATTLTGLEPQVAELVAEAANNEANFVARWNGGPVRVAICDEDALDADEIFGDVPLSAGGCWAATETADCWAVYGVYDAETAVVIRVKL